MNKFFFLLIVVSAWTVKIYSQQFVYMPINPSFGGNYFNGSFLLSEAQAQNKFVQSSVPYSSYQTDPLQNFKSSLNSQILSLLSRNLVSKIFGEDAFQTEGKYEIGDYIINVVPGSSGIHIDITDTGKGNSTSIDIPYY